MQLFAIETLEYAGSLIYSESKICQEARNEVCHAEVSKKNFQLAPTLPDAIACQFSTSRKLGKKFSITMSSQFFKISYE